MSGRRNQLKTQPVGRSPLHSALAGPKIDPMPQPEIPIERFEVFANGLDHPECVAFDRDGLALGRRRGGAGLSDRPGGQGPRRSPRSAASPAASPSRRSTTPLYVCNPTHGVVRVEADGRHTVFATGTAEHTMICPNFLVFDRRGRLYVTDSGNWKKQNGALLRFDPDGRGEVIADRSVTPTAWPSRPTSGCCSWPRAIPTACSASICPPDGDRRPAGSLRGAGRPIAGRHVARRGRQPVRRPVTPPTRSGGFRRRGRRR